MNGRVSIYSIFHSRVKQDPGHLCLLQPSGEAYSYEDTYLRVLYTATTLNRGGVVRGMRVALMMDNSPEFVTVFLALARLQAVVVPVNRRYRSLALRHILSDSRAEAIIYQDIYSEQAESALEVLDQCRVRITVGGGNLSPMEIPEDGALYGGPFQPLPEEEAVIFYSAGTLEPPKGAVYSHRRLLRNIDSVYGVLHTGHQDICAVAYPMHHFLPQICGLALCLLNGAAVLPLTGPEIPDTVNGEYRPRIRCMILDPEELPGLVMKGENVFPENLMYVLSGGKALEKNMAREFSDRFSIPLFQAYGMVEAGPVLSLNIDPRKGDSVGSPLPDHSIHVVDGGRLQGPDERGIICVPEAVMAENFCGRYSVDGSRCTDGWFHTDDLGFQDMDGSLYFLDRLENKITVNGFDVFPEVIETLLKTMEGIEDAAVLGQSDSYGRQRITAVIVAARGHRTEVSEIIRFLEGRLPRYQIPRDFQFVNHLPKNIAGKVSRQTLRKNTVHRTAVNAEEKDERLQNV